LLQDLEEASIGFLYLARSSLNKPENEERSFKTLFEKVEDTDSFIKSMALEALSKSTPDFL
jgi:vesicle coat complex subunit